MAKKKIVKTSTPTTYSPPTTDNNPNNTDIFSQTAYWSFKILFSIFILYVANMIAVRVANFVVIQVNKNISEHKRLIINQLSEIVFYIVFGMGVLMALINLGVQTATIITFMASLMVTIGLALQGILSNIFSGASMALADNFRIGDEIRIYIPLLRQPIQGKVLDLNITYIILRESDSKKIVYIPNVTVATNMIINLSRTNV